MPCRCGTGDADCGTGFCGKRIRPCPAAAAQRPQNRCLRRNLRDLNKSLKSARFGQQDFLFHCLFCVKQDHLPRRVDIPAAQCLCIKTAAFGQVSNNCTLTVGAGQGKCHAHGLQPQPAAMSGQLPEPLFQIAAGHGGRNQQFCLRQSLLPDLRYEQSAAGFCQLQKKRKGIGGFPSDCDAVCFGIQKRLCGFRQGRPHCCEIGSVVRGKCQICFRPLSWSFLFNPSPPQFPIYHVFKQELRGKRNIMIENIFLSLPNAPNPCIYQGRGKIF